MPKIVKNLQMEPTAETLTMTVDLTQKIGPSSSNLTDIIATTGGNQTLLLPDGRQIVVSVNVYEYVAGRVRIEKPVKPVRQAA